MSGDEETSQEAESSVPDSSKKSSLQERLSSSQSGMQICFMNDDLEDEEDNVISSTSQMTDHNDNLQAVLQQVHTLTHTLVKIR